jgi:hypothetical protein
MEYELSVLSFLETLQKFYFIVYHHVPLLSSSLRKSKLLQENASKEKKEAATLLDRQCKAEDSQNKICFDKFPELLTSPLLHKACEYYYSFIENLYAKLKVNLPSKAIPFLRSLVRSDSPPIFEEKISASLGQLMTELEENREKMMLPLHTLLRCTVSVSAQILQ